MGVAIEEGRTTHHATTESETPHTTRTRYITWVMKQILLLCLLGLTSGRMEGSGHFFSDDSDEDYSYEGSAEDLILTPDNQLDQEEAAFGIHFSKEIIEEDDDENVDYYLDDYEEENLILNPDPARDSVLKLVPQIEIKPKPSLTENEFAELKTSHILIMIGSACVSFGVIMLTLFFCKKSMEQKQEKRNIWRPETGKKLILRCTKKVTRRPQQPVNLSSVHEKLKKIPQPSTLFLK